MKNIVVSNNCVVITKQYTSEEIATVIPLSEIKTINVVKKGQDGEITIYASEIHTIECNVNICSAIMKQYINIR